jgi:hypothetical protein
MYRNMGNYPVPLTDQDVSVIITESAPGTVKVYLKPKEGIDQGGVGAIKELTLRIENYVGGKKVTGVIELPEDQLKGTGQGCES